MRILAPLLVAAATIYAQSASPEQLFREAVAAQQHGDEALAVRKYQEILKRYPDAVEARANLGAALVKLGRFDEAIEQYRAALAKNAGNSALRMNLALAYYKKGAFREAIEQLTALHADPADTRIATLLGDCYARLGQDDRVIAVLTPVEKAHPDDLAVAWLLGSALIRAGHKREGLDRVDRVARQGNSPEAYLLAGQTALKMNEFERARDYADAALRLNPKLPGALTLRGTVLTFLGDTEGAVAVLTQAVKADPNDFEAHLGLGAAMHTARDLDGARQHLQRALRAEARFQPGALRMGASRTHGGQDGGRCKGFRESGARRSQLGAAARGIGGPIFQAEPPERWRAGARSLRPAERRTETVIDSASERQFYDGQYGQFLTLPDHALRINRRILEANIENPVASFL